MKRTIGIYKRAVCVGICTALCTSLSSCYVGEFEKHSTIEVTSTLSFSWWGTEERSNYTIEGIEEYESANNAIDITPLPSDFSGYKENLDALFAVDKESDIMLINYGWLEDYSPDGEGFYDLYELSDYIDLDNFTKEELSYGTVDGKLNAIPISLNAITFYYNANLFDDYSLNILSTWDDLFTCAEVLSKDGIYTLTTADIYLWLMLIAHEEQISGISAFSDGFTIDNVASMMEFYKQLIDAKVVTHTQYNKDDFLEGSCAGELLWTSDAQFYVSPLEESGGSVAIGDYLCTDAAARFGWYVKPTSLYAISKTTSNPEEAAKFVNFLLNDERMATLQGTEKGVPLSDSALETLEAEDKLSGVSYEASRKISEENRLEIMPTELESSKRYDEFFTQFELYYYGQKSLSEAAGDFIQKYPFD